MISLNRYIRTVVIVSVTKASEMSLDIREIGNNNVRDATAVLKHSAVKS